MTAPRSAPAEPSLGELVASATSDLSRLLSQEVALAKLELKKEAVAAGVGVGAFGAAAFAGVMGLIFVSIAAAYGLAGLGLPLGVGFLLVAAVYLVGAGVLALVGKKSLGRVGSPARTIKGVKDDVAWAKHPTRVPVRT